ncbi:MAG: DUF3047 domain-containing protein [Deltaproteobacteria bacterium]|nr:DUF3047 domain-containing protein [Deltaproteobacteria bacterium]
MKRLSPIIILLASVSVALAQAPLSGEEGTLLVARFSEEVGGNGIPQGWKVKEWNGRADIGIVKDEGKPVLWLKSRGTSTSLYKELTLNIRELPYLVWRWKVTRLPLNGDVRKKATDDQAAQIYIVFPGLLSSVSKKISVDSKVLGYIWDTNAPQGTAVISKKHLATKYIVVKSGANGLGQWHTEKRNVYEDYKRLFGEDPPRTGKIAIMIDSDDTRSLAECFIGEIYLSKD